MQPHPNSAPTSHSSVSGRSLDQDSYPYGGASPSRKFQLKLDILEKKKTSPAKRVSWVNYCTVVPPYICWYPIYCGISPFEFVLWFWSVLCVHVCMDNSTAPRRIPNPQFDFSETQVSLVTPPVPICDYAMSANRGHMKLCWVNWIFAFRVSQPMLVTVNRVVLSSSKGRKIRYGVALALAHAMLYPGWSWPYLIIIVCSPLLQVG